jgi:hypothetical protein
MKNVACQLCVNYAISKHGSYDICPVCFWEDDGLYSNPGEVRGGPNGKLSLTEAQANFKKFGASSEERVKRVRPPQASELPENKLAISVLAELIIFYQGTYA